MRQIKVGDVIYIPSAFHISNGSADRRGGKATVTGFAKDGFVRVKEVSGGFNPTYLLENQDKWAIEYGDTWAYPDPDVNTPWIEKGDIVDGKVYDGEPIW